MALSDFRNSIGRASQTLPNVDADFEMACLWLFVEAFKNMKEKNAYDLTWKETRFSAHLVGHMRKIRDDNGLSLRIDPESYLYRQEILEGTVDPDSAPRIDIKISGAWIFEDIYYGIEGKILVDTDWRTRSKYSLRAYYIDGFDRFVSGKYASNVSRGCMAGYVVHGNAYAISRKINRLLISRERENECLIGPHAINDCPDCYYSQHVRTIDQQLIRLSHIHLTFC